MTKQELKMILKLIDSHTENYEHNPCFSSKIIPENGITKLKKDLVELFGDDCDSKGNQE